MLSMFSANKLKVRWKIDTLSTTYQLLDRDLMENIRKFSEDTKNLSLEFNEFLKMLAHDKNAVTINCCHELVEAFQVFDEDCSGTISKSQLKTILFKIGYCPLQQEDIEDIVKVCNVVGINLT